MHAQGAFGAVRAEMHTIMSLVHVNQLLAGAQHTYESDSDHNCSHPESS